MSTLDVRTRTKADLRTVDVTDFFERELPSLVNARGHLAFDGASEFDVHPLTIITQSGSWTLERSDKTFTIARGDAGASAIRLNDDDWGDFVNDLTTMEMLFNLKLLQLERGTGDDVHGWWTVLRSLIDGRPVFTAGSIVLRDRAGQPLDLGRSFTPEDDDAEMAHFLAEAGFLHLSGWLDEELMQEISGDMDREFPRRTPEDGSWWATLVDGTRCPVRIPGFSALSKGVRTLLGSDAYQRIGRLTDDGYQHSIDVEALVKPLGVVSGISNIPWHHDCATGMHSYNCSTLVVGISVTGAGPESGQLGVLPGSHRALMPMNRVYPHTGLKPLFVATRAGDMTVHCSCTLHMAKDPTEHERKVIYTGFALPSPDIQISAEWEKALARRDEVQRMLTADAAS
jgi:hypothetical protein